MLRLAILLCFLSPLVIAKPLQVGKDFPDTNITDLGELQLADDRFTYSPWHSQQLHGRVILIQAMAERSAAKELNEDMVEALKAAQFPPSSFQTVTVVNLADAVWGSSGFVKSSVRKNKKAYPKSAFIIDKHGTAFKYWQLAAKSSAIIVLDKRGEIIFSFEGRLSDLQIEKVIDLINRQL